MNQKENHHNCTIGFIYMGLIIGIIAGKKFNMPIIMLIICTLLATITGFLMDKFIK